MFQPLKTKRLLIRNLTSEDAERISEYRSAPVVAEFQSWDNYSVYQAQKLIKEMNNACPTNKGSWFQFGIELLESETLIGDIGFLNTDESGDCWIGFTLDSKHWGCGFAIEAVSSILEFYKNLGVESVKGSIDPKNQRSQKLLEKLSFEILEATPSDTIFVKLLR